MNINLYPYNVYLLYIFIVVTLFYIVNMFIKLYKLVYLINLKQDIINHLSLNIDSFNKKYEYTSILIGGYISLIKKLSPLFLITYYISKNKKSMSLNNSIRKTIKEDLPRRKQIELLKKLEKLN